ncbi:MAG: PQQ-binding-like beta-propeller repeat protein [Phycisphaerae bacterium]
MFERAKSSHSADDLRAIIERYPITDVADDALELLSSWRLDDGEPGEVIALLEALRARFPETSVPEHLIASKLAAAYVLIGDAASADAVIAGFRRDPANASESSHWFADLSASDFADALMRHGRGVARGTADAWPIAGGTSRRQGLAPAVVPTLKDFRPWRFDVPGGSTLSRPREAPADRRRAGSASAAQLVAADGRVFVRIPGGCAALDMDAMGVLWMASTTAGAETPGAWGAPRPTGGVDGTEDYVAADIATGGGLVFTIERSGVGPAFTATDFPDRAAGASSAGSARGLPPGATEGAAGGSAATTGMTPAWFSDAANRLVAYDAATGRVRWQRGRTWDAADPLGDVAFRSAPILEVRHAPVSGQRATGVSGRAFAWALMTSGDRVAYGRLWVPYVHAGDLLVGVLDPSNGALLARIYVCSFVGSGRDGGVALSPALAGGVVYVPTGRGMLVAIDAWSLKVVWASRYDDMANTGGSVLARVGGQRGAWGVSPPIVAGGVVLLAPRDRAGVVGFAAQTGDVLWTAQHNAPVQIIAAERDRAWMLADNVTCVSVRDGHAVWARPWVPASPVTGRAVRSGDVIYVPTVAGLESIGAGDGVRRALTPLPASLEPLGNLFCIRDAMFSIDGARVRKFADLEAGYRMAVLANDADTANPAAAGRRAWIELYRGEPDRAHDVLALYDATRAPDRSAPLPALRPSVAPARRSPIHRDTARLRVEVALALARQPSTTPARAAALLTEADRVARTLADRVRVGLALADRLAQGGQVADAYASLWSLAMRTPRDRLTPADRRTQGRRVTPTEQPTTGDLVIPGDIVAPGGPRAVSDASVPVQPRIPVDPLGARPIGAAGGPAASGVAAPGYDDPLIALNDSVDVAAHQRIAWRLAELEADLPPDQASEPANRARMHVRAAAAALDEDGDADAARDAVVALDKLADMAPLDGAGQHALLALGRRALRRGRPERAEQRLSACVRSSADPDTTLRGLMSLCVLYATPGYRTLASLDACLDELAAQFADRDVPDEFLSPHGARGVLPVAHPVTTAPSGTSTAVGTTTTSRAATTARTPTAAADRSAPGAVPSRGAMPNPAAVPGETVGAWVRDLRARFPADAWQRVRQLRAPRAFELTGRAAWELVADPTGFGGRERGALRMFGFAGGSPPAMADRVLVYRAADAVDCYSVADGALLWRTSLRMPGDPAEHVALSDRDAGRRGPGWSPVASDPVMSFDVARWAVADGQTVVINGPDALYALGVVTGKRLWIRPHDCGRVRFGRLDRAMAAADGVLAATPRRGWVTLMSMLDGSTVWRRDLRGEAVDDIRMFGHRIVCADEALERVHVLDRRDGTLVAKILFDQPDPTSDLVELVQTGQRLVGPRHTPTADGIVAVDIATGRPAWRLTLDRPLVQLFVPRDDRLGVSTLGGGVRVVDVATGDTVSSFTLDGVRDVQDGVWFEDRLILSATKAGSRSAYPLLVAVDPATGGERWRRDDIAPALRDTPLRVYDGVVLAAVSVSTRPPARRRNRVDLTMIDVRDGSSVGAGVRLLPRDARDALLPHGDFGVWPDRVVVGYGVGIRCFETAARDHAANATPVDESPGSAR